MRQRQRWVARRWAEGPTSLAERPVAVALSSRDRLEDLTTEDPAVEPVHLLGGRLQTRTGTAGKISIQSAESICEPTHLGVRVHLPPFEVKVLLLLVQRLGLEVTLELLQSGRWKDRESSSAKSDPSVVGARGRRTLKMDLAEPSPIES